MKKLIMSAVCAMISMMSFADTNNVAEAVDVYEFKASIKQPILKSGVRTYTTVSLKGDLYLEYESVDDGISAAYAIVKNSKTKVMHRIDFTDGFYHLMGKSTKTTVRSLPTVILSGSDSECYAGTGKGAQEPHEAITSIQFAGQGTLKQIKTKTVNCGVCGGSSTTTAYCNKLYKLTGNVTGIMDCECPDDENWNHTLETNFCGVKNDEDGETTRSHFASFFGSWSAKYKKTVAEVTE